MLFAGLAGRRALLSDLGKMGDAKFLEVPGC